MVNDQVQLGTSYEGQLNHMAEAFPNLVRLIVCPHDTHHYLTVYGQAETDSLTLIGADAFVHHFGAVQGQESA